MKRVIVTVVFAVICYLLQTTVFRYIEIAGVIPNMLLLITAYVGYINGRTPGIAAGLFCGFMVDSQYGSILGLYGLIYMTVGYINGLANKLYYREDTTMPIILAAISEFVYGIFTYILEFLLRGRLNIGYYMGNVIMPELIYTTVISIIIYKMILWLYKVVEHPDTGGDMVC